LGNCLGRLRTRREFLEVTSQKNKIVTDSFVIFSKYRNSQINSDILIGYTVSGKIGNAVVRNKVKRRLRSAASNVIKQKGTPGTNYVIIARNKITRIPFESLENDLTYALQKLSVT
tara:strand:+ start:501 stop:848 length:348 start_codon:yes stop_codon:yes gene_type:complete